MDKQILTSSRLLIRCWWLGLFILFSMNGLAQDRPGQSPERSNETQACRQLVLYYKTGCPYCDEAKVFLQQQQARFPDLLVQQWNVQEAEPRRWFQDSLALYQMDRPAVPFIIACGQAFMGFDYQTEQQLLGLIATGTLTQASKTLDLPLIGSVSLEQLGLPALTVLLGLVDGFNPCAMWVLLFLLSLLVNLKSRLKMALIAGIFVLVSGLVYFLFMAAWLNAFLVVGYSRWLQVLLGLLAVTVGVINLVDVWRDSEHFTVSIPERAKPGIYQKVRAIIRADNLALALFMAAVVAVMVNFIELLCTAGIPAVYTQILAQQELETSSYYGYLLLYNLAYIFDDSVMVAIAVWTLSRAKLQAKQGRWLKLISGLTILLLGLLLWFKPSWLF